MRLRCSSSLTLMSYDLSETLPPKPKTLSSSQLYFDAWLGCVTAVLTQRRVGENVLAAMEAKRIRERLHNAFR